MSEHSTTGRLKEPAQRRGASWAYSVAILIGLAFGVFDQYIGSLGPTGAAVSNVSALWLVVAFMVGASQPASRFAARAGLLSLLAAVVGFVLMIASPLEGGRMLSLHETAGVAVTQWRWLAAAFLAGPIYGYLGYLWHSQRLAVAASMVSAALLLEPLCRLVGLGFGRPAVSMIEAAFGVIVMIYIVEVLRHRRRPQTLKQ